MMLTSPTTSSWIRSSLIETLVTRACDPSLHEPNYALHLEVAECINTKKANNPRQAAMLVARLANHRNPHIAILALALLDTLVKSCGYPFHLQISTKEFLNELVRRFPERPPPFPGPVMSRIIDLIHEWKEGICTESRWREDLGNIRDMHRLLTFKGYRFRDLPSRHQITIETAANLKSAEELEEEDREAQSAKLQELIRRGTPRDLAAAQELMKSLAGANPDAKPDYRTQALMELNKLEQKVILLNEMLDNVDRESGERFATGDAYDQVSAILANARPKLQKWISDAQSEDPESLNTFLQINDQINTVLTRYEAFKKGDYVAASNPIPTEVSAAAANESLIDFDEFSSTSFPSGPSNANDLAGLFGTSAPLPTSNPPRHASSLNMGTPMLMQPYAPAPTVANRNGSGIMPGLLPSTMTPPSVSGTPPASIRLPGTPTMGMQSSSTAPNYFSGNGYPSQRPGVMFGGMTMPTGAPSVPVMQPQKPQAPVTNTNSLSHSQTPSQGKDPFADLAGIF